MDPVIWTSNDRKPIKAWVKGLTPLPDGALIENAAMDQLNNLSEMPFIHKHIAVMPDVHWGNGTSVGTVIATRGAIIPAAVGVDIGCGMAAVETTLTANDLPDNLYALRVEIESAVPHGRTNNGGPGDRGAWGTPSIVAQGSWHGLVAGYSKIIAKHPKIAHSQVTHHMGTLGTGNHFIELCLDERDHVWVMLHSGSRGIGNKIGSHFIAKAKEDMERYFIHLPDANLAYLPEGSQHFDDYMEAVGWAQEYAECNRYVMLNAVLNVLRRHFNKTGITGNQMAVNCHHNYVARENHYGTNVLVTRKGAVRARTGDLGIIPGSMGARSFIVRGKGDQESFTSCSHGAGRRMSRTEAKKRFTLADHAEATKGIECRKDEEVIDETPGAYKDIQEVMTSQEDLVEIVHTLRQVVCVKG